MTVTQRNGGVRASGERRAIRHRITGFTLIELIVVVVLIAVLAAITRPKLPAAGEVNLPSQAEVFASNLRRARFLAMSQYRSVCVRLVGSSEYRVTGTSGDGLCSSTALNDPLEGSFAVTLAGGATLSCAASNCANFRFKSNGEPSESGATLFTLSSGSRSLQVRVAPITGEVRVL